MFDCANVEMREMLPELAAGTLDARTRARVEEHVASCAECASELETLKLVRGAYASAPAIDTRRIVAALPKPPVAAPAPRSQAPVRRWMDWRVAAALTMITVGGLSVALNRRPSEAVRQVIDTSLQWDLDSAQRDTAPLVTQVARPHDTTNPKVAPTPPRPTQHERVQLSFGGGVSDLDEASLKALMGALDEIDRAPVALSAEPDHSPVLPAGREGTR
jgi:hypothetical protein